MTARDVKALRFAFERHDQPHRNLVILSRPPLRDVDFDELLPGGARYRINVPILQDLGLQSAFIENLFSAEDGVDGRGSGWRRFASA